MHVLVPAHVYRPSTSPRSLRYETRLGMPLGKRAASGCSSPVAERFVLDQQSGGRHVGEPARAGERAATGKEGD